MAKKSQRAVDYLKRPGEPYRVFLSTINKHLGGGELDSTLGGVVQAVESNNLQPGLLDHTAKN